MKLNQLNLKWGGALASLFFIFFSFKIGTLRAEIVEDDFEDLNTRELEQTLNEFKKQQQMIVGDIEQKAAGGALSPTDLAELLEKMKNDPDAAKEMAQQFLEQGGDKKGAPKSTGKSKGEVSLEEKKLRAMFSLYGAVPKETLAKQFSDTMAQSPVGKSASRLFPWMPRFLAAWIKDSEAPFALVRLMKMRDWLITYAGINLLIMFINWFWKRRLFRTGATFLAQFKRFLLVWTARAVVFYFMLWPYFGPSIKILIHEVQNQKSTVTKVPAHSQSAYQAV